MSNRMTTDEFKKYVLNLISIQLGEEITDKSKAMAMLCQTPKAWDYIAPKLKKDPDVMMCCQPIGRVSLDYYGYIGNDIYNMGSDIYVEEGFDYVDDIGCHKMLVPVWAKDVKRFDYRKYYGIQEQLKKGSWYIGVDRDKWDFPNPFTKIGKTCEKKSGMWACSELDVTLYDRELLKKILNVSEIDYGSR